MCCLGEHTSILVAKNRSTPLRQNHSTTGQALGSNIPQDAKRTNGVTLRKKRAMVGESGVHCDSTSPASVARSCMARITLLQTETAITSPHKQAGNTFLSVLVQRRTPGPTPKCASTARNRRSDVPNPHFLKSVAIAHSTERGLDTSPTHLRSTGKAQCKEIVSKQTAEDGYHFTLLGTCVQTWCVALGNACGLVLGSRCRAAELETLVHLRHSENTRRAAYTLVK